MITEENSPLSLEDCYTSEEEPFEWGVNLTEKEIVNDSERYTSTLTAKVADEKANGCHVLM